MKGILADVNVRGHVEYLVALMRAEPWTEFWRDLGLVLRHFDDAGLAITATDLQVWRYCQAEELILFTENRNQDAPDSLEATIRQHNTAASLPVFTIANLRRFRADRDYAERVVAAFYDYLLRIDTVRGTGRLFLP